MNLLQKLGLALLGPAALKDIQTKAKAEAISNVTAQDLRHGPLSTIAEEWFRLKLAEPGMVNFLDQNGPEALSRAAGTAFARQLPSSDLIGILRSKYQVVDQDLTGMLLLGGDQNLYNRLLEHTREKISGENNRLVQRKRIRTILEELFGPAESWRTEVLTVALHDRVLGLVKSETQGAPIQ